MARKHKHEEHQNHEAWAIPYGDLVTLLLAFFVVMYAISTVNEGKYRAVADSLNAAFRGTPRTVDPIQVGEKRAGATSPAPVMQTGIAAGETHSMVLPVSQGAQQGSEAQKVAAASSSDSEPKLTAMDRVIDQVESSMAKLMEQQMLMVTRHPYGVEIEIRTDILFPSGSATLSPTARTVLAQLADTLKPLPYAMRVEGHTDNRPISTATFPSNWELSATRAATVVHLFTQRGMDASRLAVIGLGEFRPEADNNTEQGRNINRRVVLVILNGKENAESDMAAPREQRDTQAPIAPVTAATAAPTNISPQATTAKPAVVNAAPAPAAPLTSAPKSISSPTAASVMATTAAR
jgi:chemotaxis protein MotB